MEAPTSGHDIGDATTGAGVPPPPSEEEIALANKQLDEILAQSEAPELSKELAAFEQGIQVGQLFSGPASQTQRTINARAAYSTILIRSFLKVTGGGLSGSGSSWAIGVAAGYVDGILQVQDFETMVSNVCQFKVVSIGSLVVIRFAVSDRTVAVFAPRRPGGLGLSLGFYGDLSWSRG